MEGNMLFTSYDFIFFVMLVFLLYFTICKRFQWQLLLVASYIFYAFSGIGNLLYLLATTISTYLISYQMSKILMRQKAYLANEGKSLSRDEKKQYKQLNKKKTWHLLLLSIIINIGMLSVVKYTDFTIHNINGIFNAFGSGVHLSFLNIMLPLGISFYIFKNVGYSIDVYRGKYNAESNIFKLALFTSFFPQLIQGPISRFDDISTSLFDRHDYNARAMSRGLQRILWGFFKKLVIADRMLIGMQALLDDPQMYQGVYVFIAMLFYALQLYADFTGGIDITIGISECLGIKVAENFIRPYFSKNIKEYWNRWHITMGTWFTDYIFYPISVCKPMLNLSKFSRKTLGEQLGKRVPVWLACIVVWFATGIWHGSSWNFIVWGLVNCVIILISQECEPLYKKFHASFKVEGSLGFKIFRIVRTVLLLSMIRMFDCYRDVPLTFKMLGTMVTTWNLDALWNGTLMQIGLSAIDYIILAVGVIILFTVSMIQRSGSVRDKIYRYHYSLRFIIWFGLFVITILMGIYGIGYNESQFIYNQF